MKRRLLALGLAVLMTVSTSAVTYADMESNVEWQTVQNGKKTADKVAGPEVSVTSTLIAPTITVSVPTSSSFVIDPYNLGDTAEVTGLDTVALTTSGSLPQILSPQYEIVNDSNVPVIVTVTVSNVTTTGVGLAKTRIAKTTRTKAAFVYLDFKVGMDGTYSRMPKKYATDPDTYVDGATSTNSVYNKKSTSQLVLQVTKGTGTIVRKNAVTIPEARNGVSSKAYYCFFGDVVVNPRTAWTSEDAVSCTIKFTFTPTAVSTED
jgi:hypothetical protein